MKRIKTRWLYAGLLAIVALAWPFAPDIARATFTWNSLDWDSYNRSSVVFNKVGGDTAYFNVYENAAPGVEVGDNEPGTCDSGEYRGVLWYDTSGADSGLKWCNNEDGSYNWDPMAQADEIKSGVMALGVTGTLRYEVATARSVGSITIGANTFRIRGSSVQERRIACFYYCAIQGDLRETAAGTVENVTSQGLWNPDETPTASDLEDILDGSAAEGDFPNTSFAIGTVAIMSCNCIDTAG